MSLMTGFLGSAVLEVILGLICVYLLLGLFCTAVNEWIASVLRMRAKMLHQGIDRLLSTAEEGWSQNRMTDRFYTHPLVRATMGQRPSYLSGRTFAQVLVDLVTTNKPASGSISYFDLESGIQSMPSPALKSVLQALMLDARNDMEGALRAIERWYEDAMDRVSGRYKRKIQGWTLVIATLATVAINADTLRMSRRLWIAPSLRSQVTEAARNRPATQSNLSVTYPNPDDPNNPQVTPATNVDTASDTSPGALVAVLGWEGVSDWSPAGWMDRIAGWLLTIAAVSIGAPFWFDTLSRFMNLRHAGPQPAQILETRETPFAKSMVP
jgi:hypothetical protein